MKIATIGSTCEATGHPSNCTEPAIGEITATDSHNITITDASGNSEEIATIDTANMTFDSHAHDYSIEQGCHDNQSHDLDPDESMLPNITINGSNVYVGEDGVATDPGSGGSINITDTNVNNSIGVQ